MMKTKPSSVRVLVGNGFTATVQGCLPTSTSSYLTVRSLYSVLPAFSSQRAKVSALENRIASLETELANLKCGVRDRLESSTTSSPNSAQWSQVIKRGAAARSTEPNTSQHSARPLRTVRGNRPQCHRTATALPPHCHP